MQIVIFNTLKHKLHLLQLFTYPLFDKHNEAFYYYLRQIQGYGHGLLFNSVFVAYVLIVQKYLLFQIHICFYLH